MLRTKIEGALVAGFIAVSACSAFTKAALKTAIDAALVECVYAQRSTDAREVTALCGAAEALAPVVKDLIGQREEAKAGSMRSVGLAPRDAGTD